LGAFVVNRIGRAPTLLFVSVLCIAQFLWTLGHEWARLGVAGAVAAVGGVLLCNAFFEWMHRLGGRFDRRQVKQSPVCAASERA